MFLENFTAFSDSSNPRDHGGIREAFSDSTLKSTHCLISLYGSHLSLLIYCGGRKDSELTLITGSTNFLYPIQKGYKKYLENVKIFTKNPRSEFMTLDIAGEFPAPSKSRQFQNLLIK